MRYLLDTNTCIDYLRHPHSKVRVRLQTHSPDEIALCTIVQAELYYGAWRSQNPAHNLSLLEEFFEPFASLPFCLKAARVYGEIRADLASKGTIIGPHALMIAAIALANGLTLITNNLREFERIPNLSCEDWIG
jgi:tRNA(fMet)-specific endonuclease VapC